MSESQNESQEVVDLEYYAHVREKVDITIDLVEKYEQSLKTGIQLDFFRENLAAVIVEFCQLEEIIKNYLGLSDQQLASMSEGGEIPPSVVRAFGARLKSGRNRLSSCL